MALTHRHTLSLESANLEVAPTAQSYSLPKITREVLNARTTFCGHCQGGEAEHHQENPPEKTPVFQETIKQEDVDWTRT